MIIIIGSQGRLGQALKHFYAEGDPLRIKRKIYQEWWREGKTDEIKWFFEKFNNPLTTLFITSGILNPKAPSEDLLKINFLLPRNIIKALAGSQIKIVTFGTIMEVLVETDNPYVQSKISLCNFITQYVPAIHNCLHVRLHTLYGGGQPNSFMFLGQILSALQTNSEFHMSKGHQFREYHHIEDDVAAIHKYINMAQKGVINLNHGRAIPIKVLAEKIFSAFSKSHLLNIGSVPTTNTELFNKIFEKENLLQDHCFRDTVPSVIEYMNKHLKTAMQG